MKHPITHILAILAMTAFFSGTVMAASGTYAVSYTHLDVYKRQINKGATGYISYLKT